MTLGPVQLLIIGFDGTARHPEIAAELRRLREHETVRIVDIVVVWKGADGKLEVNRESDLSLEEARDAGALARGLAGLTDAEDEDESAGGDDGRARDQQRGHVGGRGRDRAGHDRGSRPLRAQWAVPLRDAIVRAGGVLIARAWVQPGRPLGL